MDIICLTRMWYWKTGLKAERNMENQLFIRNGAMRRFGFSCLRSLFKDYAKYSVNLAKELEKAGIFGCYNITELVRRFLNRRDDARYQRKEDGSCQNFSSLASVLSR